MAASSTPKRLHVFEGEIDAVFCVVDADILPEIGELEGGTGLVGEGETLGVAIAAGIEDDAADGIRGVAAVAEGIGHGGETGDGLILAEGDEQIGEWLLGDVAGADRFGEGDEDGMTGLAAIAGVELFTPEVEQGEGLFGIADLVAEVIGNAAVGVDGVEVGAEAAGEEPGGDVEILVMGIGETAAPGAGLVEGRRMVGDAVVRGEGGPSLFDQFV